MCIIYIYIYIYLSLSIDICRDINHKVMGVSENGAVTPVYSCLNGRYEDKQQTKQQI